LMPGCGTCHQVKGFLERHHLPVELRWVTEAEHEAWVREHLVGAGRPLSLPYLLVGEEVLSGYDPAALRRSLARAGFQLRDTAAASAAADEADVVLPRPGLWVTNFLDGSLSFIDPRTGARLAPDLPLGADSNPVSLAQDPASGVVAISDMGRSCVAFVDGKTGRWLRGDREASSVATPKQPCDIVFDARRGRFYIPLVDAGRLAAFDSATGKPLHGDIATSSVEVGRNAGGLLLDPVADRILLRHGEGVLAVACAEFDGRGPEDRRTFACGPGRNMALDAKARRLYVPTFDGTVAYVDADSLDYAFGSAKASCVVVDRTPFTLEVDPSAGALLVSCMSNQTLHMLDAVAARRLPIGPRALPAAARTMCRLGDGVVAVSAFDENTVVFLDSRTGAPLDGEAGSSRAATGRGPRGLRPII
ncbi:MAG: hypothetical protein JO303_16850, partial [Caulobacteraceae bacterium]|nr:hypothetical protein [Caulobacteraceae bacterium]